jgi:hypothetical protein
MVHTEGWMNIGSTIELSFLKTQGSFFNTYYAYGKARQQGWPPLNRLWKRLEAMSKTEDSQAQPTKNP